MNITNYNRKAWASETERFNKWTIPVTPAQVAAARAGNTHLQLTPVKTVPESWIGDLKNKKVLGLACGGGQQGPIFAASGADITIFDNCPEQLARDESVAFREHLTIHLELGDMRDLSRFANGTFDMVFHPVSNCFVDRIQAVWDECYRVLKEGGTLLSGFVNPLVYIFDIERWHTDHSYFVEYGIPYSDIDDLPKEQLEKLIKESKPLEFGHSLSEQIGGQIAAGFALTGFYEDKSGYAFLDGIIDTFAATCGAKIQNGRKENL